VVEDDDDVTDGPPPLLSGNGGSWNIDDGKFECWLAEKADSMVVIGDSIVVDECYVEVLVKEIDEELR
jgi:hypothetical protein